MTDEYQEFLRRKKEIPKEEVWHSDIPHWKPPEKEEEESPLVSFGEYLEHYGKKGMRWGIINEKEYDSVTKDRSAVGEHVHNLVSKVKGTEEHEARLKESATQGIKQAETEFSDYFAVRDSRQSSPQQLNKNASDYLWGIGADLQSLKLYNDGNAFAAKNVYSGAKKFDLLMQSMADEQGVSIDELEFVKNMRDGNPSDYDALEDAVEQMAKSMGLSKEGGEKEYKEATDMLRDLLHTTGYTPLKDGVANRKNDADEEPKKRKKWFGHDGLEDDFLEHHGIRGQRWYHRRFQNYDGTRIKSSHHESDKSEDSKEEAKTKKKDSEYNSKTLQYKKKAQNLTDEELDRRNKRMQREVQYNQLRNQLQPPTKKQKRKETINKIFVATATAAAAAIMTQAYKKATLYLIKKASGGKIDLGGKKG